MGCSNSGWTIRPGRLRQVDDVRLAVAESSAKLALAAEDAKAEAEHDCLPLAAD